MSRERLSLETEAEIARALIQKSDNGLGICARGWLPALLAELQAVREERDALDTWGRRLMAVEQERRVGLAGTLRDVSVRIADAEGERDRARQFRDEALGERDALLLVARAARHWEWAIHPDREGEAQDAEDRLLAALAAPEVQALLGVDSPSGASHPTENLPPRSAETADELRRALVLAALPLETLYATMRGSEMLTRDVWESIEGAVAELRRVLRRPFLAVDSPSGPSHRPDRPVDNRGGRP